MLAEELKASDVGLEFLTGELKGSHNPSGIVFTVLAALSGMEREYIRDRTLEGHESARKRSSGPCPGPRPAPRPRRPG
ncbi:recombinase family protein [Streptomyces cyslabdanicus]|uniref:recombinase family protein n=1 Tax=Streptomyces cyslabdanicus TaxID=1470456 RepID=UPI00404396EE